MMIRNTNQAQQSGIYNVEKVSKLRLKICNIQFLKTNFAVKEN